MDGGGAVTRRWSWRSKVKILLLVLSLFNVMTLTTKVNLCTATGDYNHSLFVGIMKYENTTRL